MSIALKLEPRCPEPARLTATSAFSAAHVREQRERVVRRGRLGLADAVELARGISASDGHARRR